MAVLVNGYLISDFEIEKERIRLAAYLKNTPDLDAKPDQLRKWAEENLIERALLLRFFKENPKLTPEDETITNKAAEEIREFREDSSIIKLPQKSFKRPKKLHYLLVKPAGPDCNMKCDYCFYLPKQNFFGKSKHRIKHNTLLDLVFQISTQAEDNFYICWQGGEPSLMGLEFYKKAVSFLKFFAADKRIFHSFQTNGILLNEQWAEFFRKENFLVGISLDGPAPVHDHFRKNLSGKGTFEVVKKKVEMLLRTGVKVNVLAAVTSFSAKFPKEIYSFFKSLGIKYIQFIPIVEKLSGREMTPFSVSPEAYGSFLVDVFEQWMKDFKRGTPVSIRFFDSLLLKLIGFPSPDCELQQECGSYLVVEHDGSVYSCDFYVDSQHSLGNIHNGKLIDFLNSEKQASFGKMKSFLPEKCLRCEWLSLCRGGCPRYRFNSLKGENYLCKGYKIFFQHAVEKIKELKRRLIV